MVKNLIIIGTAGVGRETALIVESINKSVNTWNLLGFIDDTKDLHGEYINNHKVLGGIDYLLEYKEEVYIVCAFSNCAAKKDIVNKLTLKNPNIKFATIIHPSVIINKTVEVGEGCIIYEQNVITANIKIGNHVILSPKCGVGHDTIIDNYCSILWNVNISGNVHIEEGVTMGSGSTVIQKLKIGKGCYVGAGSVVIRDLEKYSKVVGVPARNI